jgi:hypothetical protein
MKTIPIKYIPSIHHISLWWVNDMRIESNCLGEWEEDFIYICMTCGTRNNYWKWNCERCDTLAAIAEDEYQQEERW